MFAPELPLLRIVLPIWSCAVIEQCRCRSHRPLHVAGFPLNVLLLIVTRTVPALPVVVDGSAGASIIGMVARQGAVSPGASVPLLKMPPPSPPSALLSERVQLVRVIVPLLKMPPPSPLRQVAMVRPAASLCPP